MTERSVPQPVLANVSRRSSVTRSPFTWGVVAGALLLALIGCGGGGGNRKDNGTTGTTTSGVTDLATVNLPGTQGQVDVTFLTGAGRAPGDQAAIIRRIQLQSENGVVEPNFTERRLVLNRYTSQILNLNVPTIGASRLFTTFQFDVLRFEDEFIEPDAAGNTSMTYQEVDNLPANIPSAIRVFPGRTTHVPFYLDTDALGISETESVPSFKISRFNAINFRPEENNVLRGRLADYVSFDITGMSVGDRPALNNGNPASRVYFSGDGYAASDGDPFSGSAVNFEPILPGGQNEVVIGRAAGPSVIPSQGGTEGETPGTYSLVQADPSDITGLPRSITSLQGTWRDHFRQRLNSAGNITEAGYLSNVGGFVMLAIPGSNDDARQDVIAVSEDIITNPNGTKRARVNNCYFGYIDYDGSKFFLYPIKNIYQTNTNQNLQGEVSGSISGTVTNGGVSTLLPSAVNRGAFSFTTGAPSGFPSSGNFVVLRR